MRDLATSEALKYQTTILVPAVPGGAGREVDGALEVRRFRYLPKRWEDLADGAILENLRRRKSRWTQVLPLFLAQVLVIRRLVRETEPDVIHIHWLIPQGIRGIVLIATLGVSMNGVEALGVGLASRGLLIVVDLLMAALAVLGSRLFRSDRTSV